MKTNTLQNKLKKMQLFFKKPLLFEKIIISLHLDKKSSGFAVQLLSESVRDFQSNCRKQVRNTRCCAGLFICSYR